MTSLPAASAVPSSYSHDEQQQQEEEEQAQQRVSWPSEEGEQLFNALMCASLAADRAIGRLRRLETTVSEEEQEERKRTGISNNSNHSEEEEEEDAGLLFRRHQVHCSLAIAAVRTAIRSLEVYVERSPAFQMNSNTDTSPSSFTSKVAFTSASASAGKETLLRLIREGGRKKSATGAGHGENTGRLDALNAALRDATVDAKRVVSIRRGRARRQLLFSALPSSSHALQPTAGRREEDGVDVAEATKRVRARARARETAARTAVSGARRDAEHDAARHVTDSMRSLRQRMAAQVDHSAATIFELSKDSDLIGATTSQHDMLAGSIARGSGLLTRLKQREFTDRALIAMGFSFFVLTILYIVKTRLGITFF